jgi:copper chaperone
MPSVRLQVAGMSCGICVKSIEGALRAIGAEGTVDLEQATVKVEHAEHISREQIEEAIKDQGFTVIGGESL